MVSAVGNLTPWTTSQPHLVALVRAGAVFRDSVLAERPEQAAA